MQNDLFNIIQHTTLPLPAIEVTLLLAIRLWNTGSPATPSGAISSWVISSRQPGLRANW